MKKYPFLVFAFFFLCVIFSNSVIAQEGIKRHKIALFAPLHLDSAFTPSGTYRFSKNEFPNFLNPGLEFYEGVKIALDSFAAKNKSIEMFVYDTRSKKTTLEKQLSLQELDSVELIIAYCSSAEVRTFANAGLKKNVPVINVNLPNEGGTKNNPFFVLLNPTLRTQCEGIYKHIQKNYAINNLVVFRKKGQLEDQIKMYFDEFGKSTPSVPLNLKYVELPDNFTVNQLTPHLDTLTETMCIAGSLSESFGKDLVKQLAALQKEKYKSIVMGMPTWDGIRDFRKTDYKGIEIIYSTPFYNSRTDKISQSIIENYNKTMHARPSDMVIRGYETMWRFGNLLLQYKTDVASNITQKEFSVIREFDIQPVINRQTMVLDYFENKKLYFLKWQDGELKAVY